MEVGFCFVCLKKKTDREKKGGHNKKESKENYAGKKPKRERERETETETETERQREMMMMMMMMMMMKEGRKG